jgi:hypothetical protein
MVTCSISFTNSSLPSLDEKPVKESTGKEFDRN